MKVRFEVYIGTVTIWFPTVRYCSWSVILRYFFQYIYSIHTLLLVYHLVTFSFFFWLGRLCWLYDYINIKPGSRRRSLNCPLFILSKYFNLWPMRSMRKTSLQEDEIFFTVFFLPVESYIVFFTSNFNSEYWLSYWVRIDSLKLKIQPFGVKN